MKNRKILPSLLVIGLLGLVWLYNNFVSLKDYTDQRYCLHTIAGVHVLAHNKYQARKAIAVAYARMTVIENKINYFDPQSELAKINREAFDHPVTLSAEMQDILEQALAGSRLSNGAFDISVTPITRLYGFGRDKKQVPNKTEVVQKLASVGYQNIRLDTTSGTVHLLKPGMQLDLGGMKGYAVDEAVKVLQAQGIYNALVNVGGNIYALGTNHGQPWQIGIRDPRDAAKLIRSFTLHNQGCATSGDYEQYYFQNNQRISHIFDPHTGRPANLESGVRSVTVVTKNATWADILGKPCFIWGEQVTRQHLPGLTAYFYCEDQKKQTAR